MNKVEQQYLDLIKDILDNGNDKDDRTGTGTMSLFGRELRHNFKDGFPLFTTRQISLKTAFIELKWFLLGRTDLRWLLENNCKIWVGDFYKKYISLLDQDEPYLSKEEFCEKILSGHEFTKAYGQGGQLYGHQWRHFSQKVDQIWNLVKDIQSNPDSRRLLVTAWNPVDISNTLLPPCHYGFQIYTRKLSTGQRLGIFKERFPNHNEEIFNETLDSYSIPQRAMSLKWIQRSGDTLLGIPTNIISYSMLLMMLCQVTNMIPEEIIGSFGDIHIYKDQIPMAKELLTREPYQLPTLTLNNREVNDISEYEWKDFTLSNYQHHPKIYIPLSN